MEHKFSILGFSKCNSNLYTSRSKWFLLSAFVLLKPMPLIQISSLKAEREDATLWSCSMTHVVHIPFLWLELSPLDLHLTPLLLAKSSPKTPSGQGLDLSGLWNWSDWALSEFLFNWPAAQPTCSLCDEVGFKGQGSPVEEGYLGSSAVAPGPE